MKRIAAITPNTCGEGISLKASFLEISTISYSVEAFQQTQADLALAVGTYGFECYVWTRSRVPLHGRAIVGISSSDTPLDIGVGMSENSFGYVLGDGTITNNGVEIGSGTVLAERVCIGVKVELGHSSQKISWYADGTLVAEANSAIRGQSFVPAITISEGDAGDISACFNFGQNRWDFFSSDVKPWMIHTRTAAMNLAYAGEAFLSEDNKLFRPTVLNPERFTIRQMPSPWFQSARQSSTFASLSLNNSDGLFDNLVNGDARDTTVVISKAIATTGKGNLIEAEAQCSAIIDQVSQSESVVEVSLRGTLASLDYPLPCRVIPPFADESSRGKIYPIGLGAQRLVNPLLFDKPNRIYVLGDDRMLNVTMVADGGAPLDPNSTPPQWHTALDGKGIQLETDAFMRLAVDCSSCGTQYDIPGAEDVLAGIGSFLPWSASPNTITTVAPDGWTFSNFPDSTLMRVGTISQASARLISSRIWYPAGIGSPVVPQLGDWFRTNLPILEAGHSYRLTLELKNIYSPESQSPIANTRGGFMLRMEDGTTPTADRSGAITPNEIPLTQMQNGTFAISFKVPAGSPRYLFLIAVASRGPTPASPTRPGGFEVANVKIERLGQFTSLPLEGISMTDAFKEILVVRAGKPESIFSSEDTDAIDEATGYKTGYRWEEPPTVLSALQTICDQYGAVMFEDPSGKIRVRRLTGPGTPITSFSEGTIDLGSVRIYPSDSELLTTVYGARRNWAPYGMGELDMVTDMETVSASLREAWQRESQYILSVAKSPANEYSHAVGAPPQHLQHDDYETAMTEGSRIVELHQDCAKIVEFITTYEETLPNGVKPIELMYNDTVEVDIPTYGLYNRVGVIVGTEVSPFANTIRVYVRYL